MTLHLVLTRRDLVNLLRGTSPSYEAMRHSLVKSHFEYCDHPQSQRWSGLEKMTEVELWTLYLVCEPRAKT
jgi:hypothetical protein